MLTLEVEIKGTLQDQVDGIEEMVAVIENNRGAKIPRLQRYRHSTLPTLLLAYLLHVENIESSVNQLI